MTYKQIASMIAGIGLPYAYHHFPEGTGQDTPFICFYFPENVDLMADNCNYGKINALTVELYTDNKDFALETAVETALQNAGLPWKKQETYINEERMYFSTYDTEVLINE